MIAAVSVLIVILISLIIVRVATVALTLTGLSKELARFQARSAFTGAGFTTNESEKVVGHPVRRRIIMMLMLLGNAGIVTAMGSLILTMVGPDVTGGELWWRIVLLVAGLTSLFFLAQSKFVDRWMTGIIQRALKRWTTLEVRDYAGLLHLAGDYAVIEFVVETNDWISERTLIELKLSDEGVLVLGIERHDGRFVGAPRGHTKIVAGDRLIMYGPRERIRELDERPKGLEGAYASAKAKREQHKVEEMEEQEEKASPPESVDVNDPKEDNLDADNKDGNENNNPDDPDDEDKGGQ